MFFLELVRLVDMNFNHTEEKYQEYTKQDISGMEKQTGKLKLQQYLTFFLLLRYIQIYHIRSLISLKIPSQ